MGEEGAVTAVAEEVPAAFYDTEYFNAGTKSNYKPYGPGNWAEQAVDMIYGNLDPKPTSMVDVGCAYGFLVERMWNGWGVSSWGFDISEYAINEKGYWARTWVGDAADPDAWDRIPTTDHKVDLVVSMETPEHLSERQAKAFLELAHEHGNRALLLIAIPGEGEDGDLSHINVKPMSWWEDAAQAAGWEVSDSSLFNNDWRSSQMGWAGRWLALSKEA
jgi:SAM-dependent methyltransferase